MSHGGNTVAVQIQKNTIQKYLSNKVCNTANTPFECMKVKLKANKKVSQIKCGQKSFLFSETYATENKKTQAQTCVLL